MTKDKLLGASRTKKIYTKPGGPLDSLALNQNKRVYRKPKIHYNLVINEKNCDCVMELLLSRFKEFLSDKKVSASKAIKIAKKSRKRIDKLIFGDNHE